MYTNRVFETVKCVLFVKVTSFQGVLIRGAPLYLTLGTHLSPSPLFCLEQPPSQS